MIALSHVLLSAKTQHKLNSHILTKNELSLSTIHEGKAMPKVAALGPSDQITIFLIVLSRLIVC